MASSVFYTKGKKKKRKSYFKFPQNTYENDVKLKENILNFFFSGGLIFILEVSR